MTNEIREPSAVKEVVWRHWAGRAATFDEVTNHGLHSDKQRQAWEARIAGWAGDQPLDALDVGCGTGFLALLLAGQGCRVTGTDAVDEMLDLARAKAAAEQRTVEFRRADAERLPFPDASFDLVVERHVIWTLPEPEGALKEWRRVLRPGGRVVLVEGKWGSPTASADHGDYAPIHNALPLYGGSSADDLAALIAAAGLGDVVVEPLMDAALWGDVPPSERYALIARRLA